MRYANSLLKYLIGHYLWSKFKKNFGLKFIGYLILELGFGFFLDLVAISFMFVIGDMELYAYAYLDVRHIIVLSAFRIAAEINPENQIK